MSIFCHYLYSDENLAGRILPGSFLPNFVVALDFVQHFSDTLAGMAVPQRRNPALLSISDEDS